MRPTNSVCLNLEELNPRFVPDGGVPPKCHLDQQSQSDHVSGIFWNSYALPDGE